MKIVDAFIACFERTAAAGLRPRVRRVCLPRAEVVDSRRGEFCALELDDGTLGLSYVLLGDTLERLHASTQLEALAGCEALELARAWASADNVSRTLGFAAVNALTRSLFDHAGFAPAGKADSLGGMAAGRGDHVGMVGHFTPLIPRVLATGARLTVIELKPDLLGEHEGYRVTSNVRELGQCNKVLCTSTVLLNDTLESVLANCRLAERLVLLGPGASCLPDPLFSRGVHGMAGSWIVDPAGVVESLALGESWSAHARKFVLSREDYPGLEQLLERVRK
jgi:uncharacterized protein (DUF4213/DUF364 family)